MSQHKALAYAEDQLGVHRTWINCESITVALADLYGQQAGFEAETRKLDYEIQDRKARLLSEAYNASPDMSAAAFERYMKVAYAEDDHLAALEQSRLEAMSRRDVIGGQIRANEANHKGHVARLNELGGYLHYLAETKAASTAAAVAAASVSDLPW